MPKLAKLHAALYFTLVLRLFLYRKHKKSSHINTKISIATTAIQNAAALLKDTRFTYRFADRLVSVVAAAQYM